MNIKLNTNKCLQSAKYGPKQKAYVIYNDVSEIYKSPKCLFNQNLNNLRCNNIL